MQWSNQCHRFSHAVSVTTLQTLIRPLAAAEYSTSSAHFTYFISLTPIFFCFLYTIVFSFGNFSTMIDEAVSARTEANYSAPVALKDVDDSNVIDFVHVFLQYYRKKRQSQVSHQTASALSRHPGLLSFHLIAQVLSRHYSLASFHLMVRA
jgi:hypothetical protein